MSNLSNKYASFSLIGENRFRNIIEGSSANNFHPGGSTGEIFTNLRVNDAASGAGACRGADGLRSNLNIHVGNECSSDDLGLVLRRGGNMLYITRRALKS